MMFSANANRPLLLVTGAGGALGQALLSRLKKLGWRVRALVLPGFSAQGADDVVEGDVRNVESLYAATKGVQAVLHMAGLILSRSGGDFFSVNTIGTQNMLQASQEQGVERFIFVSSTSVEYTPRTLYAESKWQAEQLVQKSGLPWTIVRPTLLVGKGGGAEYRLFCRLTRLPFALLPSTPKGGSALKRPVHVDDLAEGLCQLLLQNPAEVQKVYSLAGLDVLSLAEMLQHIAHESNQRPLKIFAMPPWFSRIAAECVDFLPGLSFSASQALAGFLQDASPSIDEAFCDFGYAPTSLSGRWLR